MSDEWSELSGLLDGTLAAFERGEIETSLQELVSGLMRIRGNLGAQAFREKAVAICRVHPLYARLGADPMTRMARGHADGYTNRAAILDAFYHGGWDRRLGSVSAEGVRLFQCTAVHSGTAMALRERRNFIGAQMDEACVQRPSCRILSVGSGFLRETSRSVAVIGEQFQELVAVDPDPACLEEIQRSSPSLKIKTIHAGVDALLAGTVALAGFDFIYVATLYDYLDSARARQLTGVLTNALASRGRLLIANHRPDFGTVAFVEAFMHWYLATRDAEALCALAADVPTDCVADLRSFQDSLGYIGYLSIERT
ncbi:MAG: hypothetical protein QM778_06470 [Myxococcales bacterium]